MLELARTILIAVELDTITGQTVTTIQQTLPSAVDLRLAIDRRDGFLVATSNILEPGSIACCILRKEASADWTCLVQSAPVQPLATEPKNSHLQDIQLLVGLKKCPSLLCVPILAPSCEGPSGNGTHAVGAISLWLSTSSASCRCSLSAISALADCLARELVDGDARKLHSLRLHLGVCEQQEPAAPCNHAAVPLRPRGTASRLNRNAGPGVERAAPGDSETLSVDMLALPEPRPQASLAAEGPAPAPPNSPMHLLSSWLHDPSLYEGDEAAFALWHARQKYSMDLFAAGMLLATEASALLNPEVCEGIKAAGRYFVTIPVMVITLSLQLLCKARYQQWREIILCLAQLVVAAHVAHCGSHEVAVRMSAKRIQSMMWFPRLIYAEGMANWCLFYMVRFRMACLNQVAVLVLSSALPQQMCALIGASWRCVTWGHLVQVQYGMLLPLAITLIFERRARAAFRDLLRAQGML